MGNIRLVGLLIASAALIPAGALADDYRAELDLSFDHIEPDADDSPDSDIFALEGFYYFSPVTTDGLPLAEAAFLNRSSYLGAGIAKVDVGDADADVFAAEVGYYVPGTMFFGSLGIVHADFGGGDDNTIYGSLGVTPIDGLLVTTDFDEDGWDPNVTAKYVGKIGGSNFYAASVSAVDSDDDDLDLSANFDYFFDTSFSVGAGVSSDDWTLRAEKFFTHDFALGAHAVFGDDDGGDQVGATLKWRF